MKSRAALDFMSRELSQAIVTNTIPFVADANDLAFVTTAGDANRDGMDLMEVVYRLSIQSVQGGKERLQLGPPVIPGIFVDPPNQGLYKLVRRICPYSPLSGNYWDYGIQNTTVAPWDFYNPANASRWMETSWRDGTAVLATNVLSVSFRFQSVNNYLAPTTYWNSSISPGQYWSRELGGTGVNTGTLQMQDRAPALVVIALQMLDARAAARYTASVGNTAAQQQIIRESAQTFYTSVSIPRSQE